MEYFVILSGFALTSVKKGGISLDCFSLFNAELSKG